jgi:peptide/nickel transport system permease protein
MGILRYIGKRILLAIPLVLVALTINFTIIHLAPGSPIDFILHSGEIHVMTPEFIEAINKQYGLDKPLWQQLVVYITNTLRGDLGYSYQYHKPVLEIILSRLGVTLLLMIPAFIISLILGVFSGLKSSEHVHSLFDGVNTFTSLIFWSMPYFWFGMILISVFAVGLGWLPAQGIQEIGLSGIEKNISILRHLILPMVVISLGGYATYSRFSRSSMLEILKQDYILTAWSKGCTPRMVYNKHAFRNAILPVVTLVGLRIRNLFMGSVTIETVFAWPGLGMLLYTGILRRDYNLIQAIFLIYTILTIVFNIIADVAYAYLDPRIRYGEKTG